MSTDVYIDFTNPTTGERKKHRIGFLGIMLYFEPFLNWIKDIREKHPVVTDQTIKLLETRAKLFEEEVQVMRAMDPEEFSKTYGYEKPGDGDGEGCWDDRWRPTEIREDMVPYMGWTWTTRVD